MNNESNFDRDKNSGTYSRPVHHGEVVKGSSVRNDAPNALNQNLAAPHGMSTAKRLLAGRKKS
jgi:hypothetical protein